MVVLGTTNIPSPWPPPSFSPLRLLTWRRPFHDFASKLECFLHRWWELTYGKLASARPELRKERAKVVEPLIISELEGPDSSHGVPPLRRPRELRLSGRSACSICEPVRRRQFAGRWFGAELRPTSHGQCRGS